MIDDEGLENQIQRKLILIRHSAVAMDPKVSSHEWRLSTDGRARCRQLATYLADHRPAKFITSVEPKAKETGQILAQQLGVSWRTAENLHEQDRRNAPYFENEAQFRAAVVELLNRPEERVFGLESGNEAFSRFDTAVSRIIHEEGAGNVAIVAHGTVITLYVCNHIPGLDPVLFWNDLTLPCAFTLALPEMRLLNEWKWR